MKKFTFKKIVSLVLGVAMLFPTVTAKAANSENIETKKYVALGDSISYGMSAEPGKGYVDLFYSRLKISDSDMTFKNLSVSGDTSTDLLKLIGSKSQDIVGANVVTISIGGNNFLKPTIIAISTALGVDPASPNLQQELKTKVGQDPLGAMSKIIALKDNKTYAQALQQGAMQLAKDFPQIIGAIKTLAPKAKIYVNNLYNPFDESNPFYSVYEVICNEVNTNLLLGSSERVGNPYNVIDVHSLFKGKQEYVSLNFLNLSLDPHPTTLGHAVLAEALVNVAGKDKVFKHGWQKNQKGIWYFINEKIELVKGWLLDGQTWYFMNNQGEMQTGWIKEGNDWYLLDVNGAMQTGWIKIQNSWYFLNTSGVMQTGWIKYKNNWYFLYSDGTMAHDVTINGYKLNSNGVWGN